MLLELLSNWQEKHATLTLSGYAVTGLLNFWSSGHAGRGFFLQEHGTQRVGWPVHLTSCTHGEALRDRAAIPV